MEQKVHFLRKILRGAWKYPIVFCGLLLSVFLSPKDLRAQTIVPPSHPDLVASNIGSSADFLDCDVMMTHGAAGMAPLMGFTWSEGAPNNEVKVKILDALGDSGVVNISGAFTSNIALGDDVTAIGHQYVAMVTFFASGNAYIAAYRILNVGTGNPLTLVPMYVHQLNAIGTTVVSYSIHIDMFVDPIVVYSGVFSLRKYAVCWIEQSGTTVQTKVAWGDIQNPSTITNYSIPNSSLGFTGIATSNEFSGGTNSSPYVYALYFNANNNTYSVAKIKISTSSLAGTTNLVANLGELPVIEAMGIFNNQVPPPPVAQAPWVVAAAIPNGTGGDSYAFNSANTTGINCTNGSFSGFNIREAAIAVGSGLLNNFLNHNYVVGWAVDKNPYNAYTRVIDYNSGNTSSVYPDFYQINLSQPIRVGSKKTLAMAGSSNTGMDFLSAWIDINSSKIYYKIASDVLGFKPTGIKPVNINPACTIYPNPAGDRLFMETNSKIKKFSVYDILGRQMKTPSYSRLSDNSLSADVSGLPPGIYQIQVFTSAGVIHKKISVSH